MNILKIRLLFNTNKAGLFEGSFCSLYLEDTLFKKPQGGGVKLTPHPAALGVRNLQTSRVNNSRILTIKNAKFSEYYFHMNTSIQGDFQICISVPLRQLVGFRYGKNIQNSDFFGSSFIKNDIFN